MVDELIAKLDALGPGESVTLSEGAYAETFRIFEEERAKQAAAAALASANRCEFHLLARPEAYVVFTKPTFSRERQRPAPANDRKGEPPAAAPTG